MTDSRRFSDEADGHSAERPDGSVVAGLGTGELPRRPAGLVELSNERGSVLADCCDDADLTEFSRDNEDSGIGSGRDDEWSVEKGAAEERPGEFAMLETASGYHDCRG